MALWFNLRINRSGIGMVEIRRREDLDISNSAAIQDAVSTYDVFRDEEQIGTVEHRYGDRAWKLLALATDLLAKEDAGRLRCQEPTCPDYGDPSFGEGTCPAEHAQPGAGQTEPAADKETP